MTAPCEITSLLPHPVLHEYRPSAGPSAWSACALACAEGLSILRNANIGNDGQTADVETTPLREPEYYQYELKLPDITEVWRRGSVIGSSLLYLTAGALLREAFRNERIVGLSPSIPLSGS